MSQIKVGLWGFGCMNKVILKYLLERGYQLVTVIGHHDIGSDAGEIAGLKHIGVPIIHPDNAEESLTKSQPAIVIVSTRSYLKELAPTFRILARHKCNTLTISEETIYGWNTDPHLSTELHNLYTENGVTLTGTGYQDSFFLGFAAVLFAASHRVDSIVNHTLYNLDDYGASLCELYGVGCTVEEFSAKFSQQLKPTLSWMSAEAVAVRLGCKIIKTTQAIEPVIAPKDIESKNAGLIPKGKVCGRTAVIKTMGELIDGRCIEVVMNDTGQIYYDNLEDQCKWQTFGVPSIQMVCPKPDSVAITCASAINRIPGVIEAKPGYRTIAELGSL